MLLDLSTEFSIYLLYYRVSKYGEEEEEEKEGGGSPQIFQPLEKKKGPEKLEKERQSETGDTPSNPGKKVPPQRRQEVPSFSNRHFRSFYSHPKVQMLCSAQAILPHMGKGGGRGGIPPL